MGNGATKAAPQGPPATEDPPTSIRAKALYAFWWTLQPYRATLAPGKNSRMVQVPGARGGYATVVHFNTATKALTLSFAGSTDLIKAMELNKPADPGPALAPLDFLAAAAPKAMVNVALTEGDAKEAINRAVDAIKEVVPADSKPLSILCTGYGTGGALATVAAARLALKFPQSDTTCITYGSPFVGNKAFAEVFNLLVGLSFRVEHRGDVMTSQPHSAPWTFPATWDIKCGTEDTENPHNNHTLASYYNAVMGLSESCSLPRNAPGVYLLLRPHDINMDKGSNSPWPVDDYFVPADKSAPGLTSPYDALVELGDGTLCKISDLFSKTSPVWASLEAEFEKRDPIGNLANLPGIQDSALEPERPEEPKERFADASEMAPAPTVDGGDQPSSSIQGQVDDALSREKPTSDTDRIEYLLYEDSDEDLAQKERLLDILAARRIALPLLLAQAAYRTSVTSAKGAPAISPAKGELEEIVKDPFGGAIRDIKDQILAYRLINDCDFECNGSPLSVDKKMPEGNMTDTQAYVIWMRDGTAVFAFRGTSNRNDWMSNIDFKRNTLGSEAEEAGVAMSAGGSSNEKKQDVHKPGMRGAVHRGFMRGFCAVAYRGDPRGGVTARHLAGVLKELMEAYPVEGLDPKQGPARVMCVGHSLGGALATLGATWAAGQYPLAAVSLYTFGQPRVGSRDFVIHLNTVTGYTVRVVHRLDVVPLVPLNRQGFEHYYPAGYLGCSVTERLTAVLKFFKHRSQFYLRYAADSRWGMIVPSMLVGVGDHFMDSYKECYKTAMKALGAKQAEVTPAPPETSGAAPKHA